MDERDLIGVGMVVAKAMVLALAYAMPAMLATWWRQRGQERIALLNLTLGWTGIGWLVLMAYVVLRRIRNSRGPNWRYRSRGAARPSISGFGSGASGRGRQPQFLDQIAPLR